MALNRTDFNDLVRAITDGFNRSNCCRGDGFSGSRVTPDNVDDGVGDDGVGDGTTRAAEAAEDWRQELEEIRRIQRDIREDGDDYLYYMDKLKKTLKQIKSNQKETRRIEAEIERLQVRIFTATEDQRGELERVIQLERQRLALIEEENQELQRQSQIYSHALRDASRLKATWTSMGRDIDKIKSGFGKIKDFIGATKIVDWEKAFRATQLSMGLSEQNTAAMSKNMTSAAMETTSFGYTIKDLAEMQGQFSDELGRSTMFSESTMKHMAAVSKATGLGTEGAAKFAAQMDLVGYGAGKTAEYIDQAMMDATSMGLNSTKVIKNISGNLKLLNKYNFKGGVKGLKQMAENATKMGVEMDMVAGMADKLFDIEGAVEMSAQLQVLGGEWSKLADPFKLMYMARNDMKGLQESVINATIATAEFNKETGQYEIQALELHRLKKVAEATGVDFEQLATSARKAAQYAGIRKQIRFGFNQETKKFIENTAYLNEKGQAEIMIDGNPKLVKDLTSQNQKFFDQEIKFRIDAEKRAKASRALDEKYEDIKNKFARIFFPLIERFSKGSESIVQSISDFLNNPTLKKGIWDTAVLIGKAAAKIGEFIGKFTGVSAGIVAGFAVVWTLGKWMAMGAAMRAGFMAAGPLPVAGGPAAGGGARGGAARGGNMRFGGGLAIAGMLGAAATNAFTEEGSTANTLGNIASGAATGAGMGMMFGPWGAAIGGLLGAGMGYLNTQKVNDGVVFNPNDKFMKVNDGTMIAGTNVNGNKDLAKQIMNMNGAGNGSRNGSTPGTVNVAMSELKINLTGKIDLGINGIGQTQSLDIGKELMNDSYFIRNMTRLVHRETAAAVAGKTS